MIGGVALSMLLLAPSGPDVSMFRMPDGLDVVLVRTREANDVAFRALVRVGASDDPFGLNGIVHVLEHLIFHGTYTLLGRSFRERLAENGAEYNAMTSLDYTYYILDAPRKQWRSLAGDYLDVLTNPALTLTRLEAELGVVDSEALLFTPRSLFSIADLVLFPSANQGTTPVIGSRRTRRGITDASLVSLYQRFYIPTNVTVLVVGDVSRSEVETLLEEHVHWAPQPEREAPRRERLDMNVPVEQTIVAYPPATMYGYAVPKIEGLLCRQLAELLQLRLTVELVGERALASSVMVNCARMRGRRLLLAATLSRSYESGLLPDAMRAAFDAVQDRLATGEERSLIQQRMRAQLRDTTSKIAERLIPVLADPPSIARRRQVAAILDPPLPSAKAMRKEAKNAFLPERRVRLQLNPFKR